MTSKELDRMDTTAREGSRWPESTQSRADVLTLTAEVRRLAVALADEERASARLLTERDRLTEAIDAIHAMTGCTHEWSNLHSCDACAVEGVGAMVTPGAHAETLRRVHVALSAFGVADCDDPIDALEAVAEEVPQRDREATDEHNAAVLRARVEGRAAGLREALDACNSVKGRLLDKAMDGGGPIDCREAFGEEDPLDADGGECELIAAGASLCGEAIKALTEKGGGA